MTKEWVGDELPDIYAVDDNTYTYHLHKHQFCKDLLCQMEEMENI